jgi:hypothetical protein
MVVLAFNNQNLGACQKALTRFEIASKEYAHGPDFGQLTQALMLQKKICKRRVKDCHMEFNISMIATVI